MIQKREISAWVCPDCEVSKSFRPNPELDDPDLSESERDQMPQLICNVCGAFTTEKMPVYRSIE